MDQPYQTNIKELHEKTGHYIRLASKSSVPLSITDRGKVIAVISSPHLVIPPKRVRKIIPDFSQLFASQLISEKASSTQSDLDALRGDL